MKKTIREFREEAKPRKRPQHRQFFLNDLVERDPGKYCPNCASDQILVLHTHNVDGIDYKCGDCDQPYTIYEFDWGDD